MSGSPLRSEGLTFYPLVLEEKACLYCGTQDETALMHKISMFMGAGLCDFRACEVCYEKMFGSFKKQEVAHVG
jgi:hypothetical protein